MFHRKAAGTIPGQLEPAFEPVLETIAVLTTQIADIDKRLEALIRERYPQAKLLQQVLASGR
jgi:hypothetical protein